MINLLGLFIHKRRFKKGEIVEVKWKKKKLFMIGHYGEVSKSGLVKLSMTLDIDSKYGLKYFNTRFITVPYNYIKKVNYFNKNYYLETLQHNFSLEYINGGKFWKDPRKYSEGDMIFVFDKKKVIVVDYFGKSLSDGSIIPQRYLGEKEEIRYSMLSVFPAEYNRAWL